ncbi:hypothetical protein H7673_10725, partial [Streptococcus dysgalactiae subsp. equisimilis]|nr:hypothetical protein [Streptococcus dysgalactiae subsp. equisimilis]
MLCDVSLGHPRPYVPLSFRRQVFLHLHNLSHPGVRSTVKLITERFVWPNINRDVRNWARACLQCQRVKTHRHTQSPLCSFPRPKARFHHAHVDLVWPLPPYPAHVSILTCADPFANRLPLVSLLRLTRVDLHALFF